MMCGDGIDLEQLLHPLADFQCCYSLTQDDSFCTVVVEYYMDNQRLKVSAWTGWSIGCLDGWLEGLVGVLEGVLEGGRLIPAGGLVGAWSVTGRCLVQV